MAFSFTKNLTIPKTVFPVCENICVGKDDIILADEEFVICKHSRESFWAFNYSVFCPYFLKISTFFSTLNYSQKFVVFSNIFCEKHLD